MSNLKKLVVSLELAKKLKELGCEQESEFWWKHHWVKDGLDEWELVFGKGEEIKYKDWGISFVSAFLSGEIGEMLPTELEKDGVHLSLMIQKIHIGNKSFTDYGKFGVAYLNVPTMSFVLHSEIDILPEALGKMLVYLKENKLI